MCFGDGFLKSQCNWYKILKKQLTPTAVLEILFSRFLSQIHHIFSLRKWPTFRDGTTGFPAKWRLRNEGTNFILMTCHCRGQSSASDWLCCERYLLQPIRSTTQIWVVTRHQYGILGLVLGRHFAGTPEEESWKAGCFVRCANLTKKPASQVSRDANRLSSDATTSESSQHSTRHWIVCWSSLTVDLIFFLQTGDSVMVAGQKTGTVRFVGRTQFASGWVLWIALEEEISFLPHLHWRQYWDPFPFFFMFV